MKNDKYENLALERTRAPFVKTRLGGAIAQPSNHVVPFLMQGYKFFAPAAPVLLLVGLIVVMMAFGRASELVSALTEQVKTRELERRGPLVEQIPLSQSELTGASEVLRRLNTAVHIDLPNGRNVIQIWIDNATLLPEWTYAVSTLNSTGKGVAWSATKICLKKCEQANAVASIEIKGYTQRIRLDGSSAQQQSRSE
jgi:hypothetical protein